jgi:hypothetical protein
LPTGGFYPDLLVLFGKFDHGGYPFRCSLGLLEMLVISLIYIFCSSGDRYPDNAIS